MFLRCLAKNRSALTVGFICHRYTLILTCWVTDCLKLKLKGRKWHTLGLLVVHYEFLGLFYSCPCSSPPGPHIIPQPKRFESPLRTRTQSPATKAQTGLNPLHVEFPENELFYRTGAELSRVPGRRRADVLNQVFSVWKMGQRTALRHQSQGRKEIKERNSSNFGAFTNEDCAPLETVSKAVVRRQRGDWGGRHKYE